MWAWKHRIGADGKPQYTELKGDIVFKDVDFGYDEKKIVLHDINLYAPPRPEDRLRRLHRRRQDDHHEPHQPLLRYPEGPDPVRRPSISNPSRRTTLRSSLGIVLQDTHLFTGTVMENIRYGRLDRHR